MTRCCRALALLFAAAPAAAAVPQELPVQGTLYDASGTPVDGTLLVTFGLYEGRVGGDPVWTETRAVGFEAGAFVAQLGEDVPLSAVLFADHSSLWLGVQVEGDPFELPRFSLGMTPYAAYAERATDADFLEGFRADDFALAGHAHDYAELGGVPADLVDGDDDTQLSEAEVDAYVADNGYLTAVGWDDVGSKPAEVTDLATLYADVATLQADLAAADVRIAALEAAGGGGGGDVYIAHIDAGRAVASQSSPWVSTVTSASTSYNPRSTVTFEPGTFVAPPDCLCTGVGASGYYGAAQACSFTAPPTVDELTIGLAAADANHWQGGPSNHWDHVWLVCWAP